MPRCRNCSGFVTQNYVQVFAPPEMTEVRVCPHCEDHARDGEEILEAYS